jgi:hypothetical protein
MKFLRKLAAVAALGLLTVPAMALDLSMTTKFDSESVSSGCKGGKEKVSLNFEVGDDVWGGSAYVGLDTRYAARGMGSGKVTPYLGYTHALCDWLSLDGYYKSAFYSNVSPEKKHHTNELGVDMKFGPHMPLEVELFYNFDEKEFGASAAVVGRYNLSSVGMSDFMLLGKASFGCDRCERPGGVSDFFTGDLANDKKAYVYYALNGDCVYTYNDNVDRWLGLRLAGNGASKQNWNNDSGHQNALWFAAGIKCSF